MTTNKELMAQARRALAGNWKLAITAVLLVTIIKFASQIIPGVRIVAPVLIAGPLSLGLSIFVLTLIRSGKAEVKQVFAGFDRFGTALATYLLSVLFIILWACLLIVPGIVAAFRYSQIFFILADNPDIGPLEAIDRSKAMMMGNKWKLFCLGWRFFGWILLSILTLGIGFIWLMPYMSVTFAKFYEDVRANGDDEVVEITETVIVTE